MLQALLTHERCVQADDSSAHILQQLLEHLGLLSEHSDKEIHDVDGILNLWICRSTELLLGPRLNRLDVCCFSLLSAMLRVKWTGNTERGL